MLHKNCQGRGPVFSMEASARLNALDFGGVNKETHSQMDCALLIKPGDTSKLFTIEGAGCIRSLLLTYDTPSDMKDLRIEAYVDGAALPQVEGFVSDFFLSGWEGRENTGDYAGKNHSIDGKTALYRLIDIPYRTGCTITVQNASDSMVRNVELVALYQPMKNPIALGERALLCSAERCGHARDWHESVTMMDVKGPGILDSIQFSMRNALTRGQFMEGNFEIYLDDNPFPEYQSTGTEEFFMGGIYFTNLHESAYSGCTRTFNDGGENPENIISAHRSFREDPLTWKHHIRIVWHNGQYGQGAVMGPTAYRFLALYYTKTELSVEDHAVTAEEADRRLSMLDGGNAASRSLQSCRRDMAAQNSLLWNEPGTLETLALHFQRPLLTGEAEKIMLSFVIDGCEQDDIPLSMLMLSAPEVHLNVTGNGGCTSMDSYHRYLSVSFESSLEIVCKSDIPVEMYAEWRTGKAPYAVRSRLIFRDFPSDHGKPVLVAGGKGWVESICIETPYSLDMGCVEWGNASHEGMSAVPMHAFFLSPGKTTHGERSCDAVGFTPVGKTGVLAYRVFDRMSFTFCDGLEFNFSQDKPVKGLIILHEVGTGSQPRQTINGLMQRLNVLDGAAHAYEGRCYNPIEDCQYHPTRISKGETHVMFEDFGPGMLTGIRFGSPWTGEALHEAKMRIWIDEASKPAIETTCARFFSSNYEDPLFWSHTRTLLRPSKRGWENKRNDGTHTSFLRYIKIPYKEHLRFELVCPDDSEIGGFDNVYWASARSEPADFGAYGYLNDATGEAEVSPGERVCLVDTQGSGLLTSLQMMAEGADPAMRQSVLEICDGKDSCITVPLWQFFMGTPGEAQCLDAEYLEPWKTVVNEQEGYFSAPEVGWIRRGRKNPYHDVMYRLMERKPFLFRRRLSIWLTNKGSSAMTVRVDSLIRSKK